MRFIFKTDYAQDLQLFKHSGQTFWYGALAVALVFVPWLLSPYFVSQLTFVLIYSIVALGLMLLSGFTGQISLGHAAFLAVGAYTEGVLAAKAVREVARRVGVEMPISEQIYRVLYEGLAPKDAVVALMQRTVKVEND